MQKQNLFEEETPKLTPNQPSRILGTHRLKSLTRPLQHCQENVTNQFLEMTLYSRIQKHVYGINKDIERSNLLLKLEEKADRHPVFIEAKKTHYGMFSFHPELAYTMISEGQFQDILKDTWGSCRKASLFSLSMTPPRLYGHI